MVGLYVMYAIVWEPKIWAFRPTSLWNSCNSDLSLFVIYSLRHSFAPEVSSIFVDGRLPFAWIEFMLNAPPILLRNELQWRAYPVGTYLRSIARQNVAYLQRGFALVSLLSTKESPQVGICPRRLLDSRHRERVQTDEPRQSPITFLKISNENIAESANHAP